MWAERLSSTVRLRSTAVIRDSQLEGVAAAQPRVLATAADPTEAGRCIESQSGGFEVTGIASRVEDEFVFTHDIRQ